MKMRINWGNMVFVAVMVIGVSMTIQYCGGSHVARLIGGGVTGGLLSVMGISVVEFD